MPHQAIYEYCHGTVFHRFLNNAAAKVVVGMQVNLDFAITHLSLGWRG